MWSDSDIYFQNLEEDDACVRALECLEVFGTQPSSQPGLDHVLGSLCAQDQGFGLPVDDPVDWSDDEDCERAINQLDFQQRLVSQTGGNLEGPGRLDFELQPYVDRESAKMGVRERHFSSRLRQTGNFIPQQNVTHELEQGLRRAMNNVLDDDMSEQDRLYFTIGSDRLTSNFQGWGVTVREWRQGSDRVDALFQRMANSLNSNENFELEDSFQVSITHVRQPPRGAGTKRKLKPGHQASTLFKKRKNTVIPIQNTDDLCCARAIVTARAKVEGVHDWQSIRRGHWRQQELALELHTQAQVPQGDCGYAELTKFQEHLKEEYRLIVVYADQGFHCKAFAAPGKPELILLHEQNHYDVVTSLPGFFGTSYTCAHCLQGYNNAGHHKCKKNRTFCRACRQQNCLDFLEALPHGRKASYRCHDCFRQFFGERCYQQHLVKDRQQRNKPESSVCKTIRRCKACFKLESKPKNIQRHRCGYARCPSCQEYRELSTHKCFIQPPKRKCEDTSGSNKRARGEDEVSDEVSDEEEVEVDEEEEEKEVLYVFFDIEAMQLQGSHEANLLVAETSEDDEPHVFEGSSCVREFLDWLEELTAEDTRLVTVIAHNFQGYDGYFVVHDYYGQNQIIQQLRNGAKLLEVKHDNVRFIDSLSFMAMPLAAFPKTFGITELKKGYFPHLFNVPEHQDYVGELPAKDYYIPESMSPKGRKEFETWHKQQRERQVEFNFAVELVEYCKSDVRLLKEGCMTFMNKWLESSTFNPFECVTIASACNRDLRENHLIPQSIASEPVHGWKTFSTQSNVAREYLYWTDHQLRQAALAELSDEDLEAHDLMALAYPDHPHPAYRHYVQHVDNGGEFTVPGTNFKVDGYCAETNTIYEFHGCFYHGCPTCYTSGERRTEKHQRLNDLTFYDVYERTKKRTQTLRDKGFHVVEMWECAWQKEKEDNPDIQTFVNKLNFIEPLNPREAFSGGRTNATKLYYKAADNERIRYIDYTSLYPWVNKTARYPVGHPTFISQPDTLDISRYFGFVKCRIVPPYGLYHPVLPSRKEEKLTFPLCPSCVEENLKKPLLMRSPICHHTRAQRTLTGTWCTPEVEKALELGYEIDKIYEVWHFPETQTGLFASYVNNWLKIKQEASGWPSGVDTEEQKRAYIADYRAKEGIELDYDKIEKNPGLRAVAKIALNSMWGKFGQNLNKTQIRVFNDPQAFHEFLDSDAIQVSNVCIRTPELVEVHYKYQTQDIPVNPHLNIFVAAFTTCWARLRLYEALELLGHRVVYFDTDSVVYVEHPDDPNEPQPVVGNYLGDFTDECDDGDYIVEFVSGGPKNYGYRTKQGKVECKVRGFRLNSEGKEQLNYQIMRDNVLAELNNPLKKPREHQVIKSFQIFRDAQKYALETRMEAKFYKLVYDKRVIDSNTKDTLPYGYYQGQ